MNSKYFQEALSDFVYDTASGRAICHLTDTGYTAAQIMREIDYPTPFAKVQHTMTRHLKETGILLEELPAASAGLHTVRLNHMTQDELFAFLARHIHSNGEENAYISCPFGIAGSRTGNRTAQALSLLTAREREYLDGIVWGEKMMYHRLNRRMLEIGAQIAMYLEDVCFYFLKNGILILPYVHQSVFEKSFP